MIAILDCRELKYRIQRKLNHRFGDDIKIKFEHDEAELMRDSQQYEHKCDGTGIAYKVFYSYGQKPYSEHS